MADRFDGMLDYLDWRGDLSFAAAPFNDVDALALCQIAYMPFDGLVPGLDRRDRVSFARLAQRYLTQEGEHKSSLGVLIDAETMELLQKMAASRRFRNVRAGFYINDVDMEEEKQFCAITFFISEELVFVAYRGTDDTLVGWKEDFNMSFRQTVPAQLEADRYFQGVMKNIEDQGFDGKVILGGHSKGGNLAVYAGMMAEPQVQELLEKIYNFDGPGFGEQVIESSEYLRVKEKIHTLLPQSSVVGMLLGHEEEYTVVKSRDSGLLQHNPLSWQVLGPDFVTVNHISAGSTLLDRSLKQWIAGMEPEQTEGFVEAMFQILGACDAETLTQLTMGRTKNVLAMIRSYKDCSDDTKALLKETMKSLGNIGRNTFFEFLTKTVKNNKI